MGGSSQTFLFGDSYSRRLIDQLSVLRLARGELHEKTAEAHQAAVGVYGMMKTRYRNDPGSLEAIKGLPTQDQSLEETRVRLAAISALWARLPNDPYANPSGPMVAGPGMDKTAFATQRTALVDAEDDFTAA